MSRMLLGHDVAERRHHDHREQQRHADDRLLRREDAPADGVGGRSDDVAVAGDGERGDARAGERGEDARDPVLAHAREPEHREAERRDAAREEQLQAKPALDARDHERPERHADRKADEHERLPRAHERLERRDAGRAAGCRRRGCRSARRCRRRRPG